MLYYVSHQVYVRPYLIVNIAGKTKRHGVHASCCDVNKQLMSPLTTTFNYSFSFHQLALGTTTCVILVGYKNPPVTSLCSFWFCCTLSPNHCRVGLQCLYNRQL